jgi:hypothetical protein
VVWKAFTASHPRESGPGRNGGSRSASGGDHSLTSRGVVIWRGGDGMGRKWGIDFERNETIMAAKFVARVFPTVSKRIGHDMVFGHRMFCPEFTHDYDNVASWRGGGLSEPRP